MMRNPVHSRHVSTKPPRSHRSELSGTTKSGRVCEDVTDSGEGAHVDVTSDEVDVVLHHVGVETSKKKERLRRRASWPQHCEHGLSRT